MFTVAAFYKFKKLDNLTTLQKDIKAEMLAHNLKGTILLAEEGINSTIAGNKEDIEVFYSYITKLLDSDDINWKLSYSELAPFEKVKVRLKKEIVAMKKDIKSSPGEYINAKDWDDFISQKDVILIETRNKYEYSVGVFKNSALPDIDYFRDFPAWIDKYLEDKPKSQKIAMFCTGGIRCEKTTAYLKDKGFDSVYHLKGGILKYLEETGNENGLWQGDCFVFDDRVAVDDHLKEKPNVVVAF